MLLSLLSITLGININNYGNDNLGKPFSLINLKNKATSVASESRLKVTTIDGKDASGKYQVVDRGNVTLSTQITTSGDYLITQDDSSTFANEQIVIVPNVTCTIKLSNLNLLYSTSNEKYHESTIQVGTTSNVTFFLMEIMSLIETEIIAQPLDIMGVEMNLLGNSL